MLNEVYDLFIDLDATEEQLDFPVLYTSARAGTSSTDAATTAARTCGRCSTRSSTSVPPPRGDADAPLQMLVANLDSSDYLGRIAIGRIFNGRVKVGDPIAVCKLDRHVPRHARSRSCSPSKACGASTSTDAAAGDIVCLAGIEDITIGETIADVEHRIAVPPIAIDEPTVSMIFGVNTSPMSGRDGQFVTSRQIKDRLDRELLGNVSIRVEPTDTPEQMKVLGRGELQLSILIEMMRREGFELQVSRPDIVTKDVNGKVDGAGRGSRDRRRRGVPGRRHRAGRHAPRHDDEDGEHGSGRVRLEFRIPARGLIGFRSQFLTETKGTGIMNHLFAEWEPWHGAIPRAATGALVADRTGVATAYAIWNLQERGEIFIEPAAPVYEGMIIGENARASDMDVNVTKEKKQTNMRASTRRRSRPPDSAAQARARAGDRVHQRRRARRSDAARASASASACWRRTCGRRSAD